MAAVDPANPQTWNRYAYVNNNPTNLVDTLGLCVLNGGEPVSAGKDEDGNYIYTFATDNVPCPISWYFVNNDPSPIYPRNGGGSGGGGGGGGTGSNGTFRRLPNITVGNGGSGVQRFNCASQFGSNHSIAAAFGAQNNFVANLFGGNSVSGLANLALFISGSATPTASQLASIPLKGAAQGIPVPPGNPGLSGAVGQIRGLAVQTAVTAGYNAIAGVGQETIELGITTAGTVATPVAQLSAETLSNVAFGAGVAKFGFDAATFLYGYFVACHP